MLLRIIGFFIVLIGVALGADWVSRTPGSMVVVWHGWQIQTTAAFAAVALALLFVAGWLVLRLYGAIAGAPRSVGRRWREKRAEQGQKLLAEGFAAALIGDGRTARKAARQARRLVPGPAADVLEAQSAALLGDHNKALPLYENLSRSNATAAYGLQGLADEAVRQNAWAQVQELAGQTLATHPESRWALWSLFQAHLRHHRWAAALDMLHDLDHYDAMDPAMNRDFLQAVLYFEQAKEARAAEKTAEARFHCRHGLRAAPGFAPLAELYARLLLADGNIGAARRALQTAWYESPAMDVLDAWLDTYDNEKPRVLEKAAKKLAKGHKIPLAEEIALGKAYLRTRNFAKARAALEKARDANPCRDVLKLFADLEEALEPNSAAAVPYLKAALEAPESPLGDGGFASYQAWRRTLAEPATTTRLHSPQAPAQLALAGPEPLKGR